MRKQENTAKITIVIKGTEEELTQGIKNITIKIEILNMMIIEEEEALMIIRIAEEENEVAIGEITTEAEEGVITIIIMINILQSKMKYLKNR